LGYWRVDRKEEWQMGGRVGSHQVESANCAIEAGADESMSGREPLDGYHRRTVFAESHEAKAAVHVPHLDLHVINKEKIYMTSREREREREREKGNRI
jgi:hypothetical protein